MLKKFVLSGIFFLILISGGIWYWLNSLLPAYEGTITLKGIKSEVNVYFDNYGVPHIYAKSEEDAYFALGYVVAQDRLFQLEILRRLASGRLAEIVGNPMVKSDKFFRTLGLKRHADWSAQEFKKTASPQIQASTEAYIAGVNQFINAGVTPIEFSLMGIEKSPFTLQDVFLITGYMSFGFAEGFRHDPMIEGLFRKVGDEYMNDLELGWPAGSTTIPVQRKQAEQPIAFATGMNELFNNYPVAPWMGSNSWVMAPSKTKNKNTLLCNDTHMGYSQPAVWYEAHIEYPGFKFYGNHLAGFPFALTGHSDFCGNGLTMFENDDTDFFIEKLEGDQVIYKNEPVALKHYRETIFVKDSDNVELEITETPHGPLIENVFERFPLYKVPVSVWWSYLKFPSHALEVVYKMNHAKSLEEARNAASQLESPGLNIMYGDKDGHIAWWAAARLIERRKGMFTKRFLIGDTGEDDPIRFLDFSENPQQEDPEAGYVYSANNQPDSSARSGYYPGYYVPENRAKHIVEQLSSRSDWDIELMKKLITNGTSSIYSATAKELMEILGTREPLQLKTEVANRLSSWGGVHGIESVGAVIFYKWIYLILEFALKDEMGSALFNDYMNTHIMKTSYPVFLKNEDSKWWDNSLTRKKEKRIDVISAAWHRTIEELSDQFGKDPIKWTWKRVHTLEHIHPIGRKKPFNLFFNVGETEIAGGNEVINNTGFWMDSSGTYPVKFGPAMRRIVDFENPEKSLSILPTGQSGYFFAPHYQDQAELYNNNLFRPQLMNKQEIIKKSSPPLILKPTN